MKSSTASQFHELISKLLTKTDHKKINFNVLQDLIQDPEKLVSLFIDFINYNSLQYSGICIADRSRKKMRPTTLQFGDQLIFYTRDQTMKVYRQSLGHDEFIYFNGTGHLDQKSITRLTDPKEILQYCSFITQFIYNCGQVKLLEKTGNTSDVVHVVLC